MKDDLISRSALLEELNDTKYAWQDYDAVEGALRNIPAVDAVEPVRHGEWRIFRDGCVLLAECSECGTVQSGIAAAQWDYCPMCGCRMDGGAADDQA